MTIAGLIEGATILRDYYDNPNGYHVGAEHDQIFLWATQRSLPPEKVARMRELGWFQSYADEDTYDPEDGWSAFV